MTTPYVEPPTRRISVELTHDIDLPAVVPALLAGATTDVKRRFAAGLGRSEDARAVPLLLTLLRDQDVAMAAAYSVADLHELAVPPLWDAIDVPSPQAAWPDPTKPNRTVSGWCLNALYHEGPRAVPFLLARFRKGNAADRRKALTVLRYMHQSTFDLTDWPDLLVSEIIVALDAPDSATRVAALVILEKVVQPSRLAPITARMRRDTDPVVAAVARSQGEPDHCDVVAERIASCLRAGASTAARRYAEGTSSTSKGFCDRAVVRRVVPFLADRRRSVRAATIEILHFTVSLAARRALGRALAVETVPELQRQLVEAGVDPPTLIVPFLASPDRAVRQAAIDGLGASGTATAVPALARLLADADAKRSAQAALARIGGREALGALVAAYRVTPGDEMPGRGQLLAAIGWLGGIEALEFLTQVLESPGRRNERWSAAKALVPVVAGVGTVSRIRSRIQKALDQVTTDPDAELRIAALELFRAIDDHTRLQAVARSDPDAGVRAVAARTLHEMAH